MNNKIIAVDFDGTLAENKYPYIGEANKELIHYLIQHRKNGGKVILWTCRDNKELEDAVNWCGIYGLEFDAVNDNLPEIIKAWHTNPRKIFANLYIDDRNKMVYKKSKYGEWINVGENCIGDDIWYCSKCDHDEICEAPDLPRYCPKCGGRNKIRSEDKRSR